VTAPPRIASVAGFLNVDKPRGMTSFDVVRDVRRAVGVKRVGHAGTLDPLATGVLPVAIGGATRFVDELVDARKGYRTTIRLGEETDTYDAEGDVLARCDARHLEPDAVRAALEGYVGTILQRPPAFSAIKRDGVPAYAEARAGEPRILEERPVLVHRLTLLDARLDGDVLEVDVDIECGKGFYVRSLAHDLGAGLEVGGHVSALRRTRVGPFAIEEALPLDVALALLERGHATEVLHAPDAVLTSMPAVIFGTRAVAELRHGRDVRPAIVSIRRAGEPGERARCYDLQGQLVAIVEGTTPLGTWHPSRVLVR
jgi:tRNA pseudouridine55 synthase